MPKKVIPSAAENNTLVNGTAFPPEVEYLLIRRILELEPNVENLRKLIQFEDSYLCECQHHQDLDETPNSSLYNEHTDSISIGFKPNNLNNEISTIDTFLPYSRGGGGGCFGLNEEDRLALQEEQAQLMKTIAISYAAEHGCHLQPGVATRGLGDCLIEACIDQFLRPGFEVLGDNEKEPQYWRNKVADMVEENINAYKMYRMIKAKGQGTKQQQWTREWTRLRQPGQFDCKAGDFVAPGLATILHKNILVFNTYPEAQSPVTVHLATTLGGSTTTNIPILLCYDRKHYEGLLPVTEQDKKKIKDLLQQYSPKKKENVMDVICPIPGNKKEVDIKSACISSGFKPIHTHSRTNQYMKSASSSSGFKPIYTSEPIIFSIKHLCLTNPRNLCFTNSVVQLIHQTEIKSFLITELPTTPDSSISTAQELARLYKVEGKSDSARNLCKLTADNSNKHYLSSGEQQDAEEFLRALLDVLEKELVSYSNFTDILNRINGRLVEHKKFVNTKSGKCNKCGNFPSRVEENFPILQLIVPNCT